MSGEILLLSGPNLSQLGTRNPAVYGTATLADHVDLFTQTVASAGYTVRHVSSDAESDLVLALHEARTTAVAVAINPGALTHGSWSLRDALEMFAGPRVEVHVSNPAAREPFRALSTIAGVVSGSVAGFGPSSYWLAAQALLRLLG